MKRVAVLLGSAILMAALGWAIGTAAAPIAPSLPGADRGPEPLTMAIGALGLLAIGTALKRRG